MTIISILGKNAFEEMECLHRKQKSVKHSTWIQNLKNDRMISVCFQGRPFNITVIQVYASTANVEEAEVERFCEDL